MKAVLILVVAIALSACATRYETNTIKGTKARLDPGHSVLVAVPQDGSYGGRVYQNSGQMTAQAIRAAFLRVGPTAKIAKPCEMPGCIANAQSQGHGYFIQSEILRWEDRATAWSGISDKVEIRVSVYDVAYEKVVSSQVILGASSHWTFGGDHPQDLLPEPLTSYVQQLYYRHSIRHGLGSFRGRRCPARWHQAGRIKQQFGEG